MATGKFVAYYRVSTERQGQSGLGLEAQMAEVNHYLNGGDWALVDAFTEVESGMRKRRLNRPQLKAALSACKKHKATLVIAKLDRLARNVAFIANLMESGIPFVAVDRPNAKPFELHIYAAMAEEEGRAISARTKSALMAARQRGTKMGWANPKRADKDQTMALGRRALVAEADTFAEEMIPILDGLRKSGVETLRDMAAALNARGIKTRRGGAWYATTVRNLLVRQT
jgi:DNA invertase Pin-like site-specific DNA recombinase